jgi:hypothetical protein
MTKFKIGDDVILVPPVDLKCEYIPWVGRFAKVLRKDKSNNGSTMYKIEVNGGEVLRVPVEWLKTSQDEITPR